MGNRNYFRQITKYDNFHLKNVMRKLDATSRTVAVVKALKLGIIEPP